MACATYPIVRLALDLEWDLPLENRQGGATRLGGIDLYYEFDWDDYFTSQRAQFRNGQCLARLVRETCPADKTPVLLLTARDEVPEGVRETDEHYVFVLNLPRYREATADAALSYLAYRLGRSEISHLNELLEAAHPEVVSELVESRIDLEHIAKWAAEDSARLEQLRGIAGLGNGGVTEASLSETVAALAAMGGLDKADVAAIAQLFGPGADRERRLELLRRVTEDPTGRYVTGEVLLERTPQRIGDARMAITAYQALLDDPSTDETAMQHFLEDNLWLLGLHYARMRHRQQLPRGVMDFILERHDGFHDLLELKSPQDDIVRAPEVLEDAPPSASDYALSPVLAEALAQVHVYRDVLTTYADTAAGLYGLHHTRDPRLIIVIGKADPLPEHRRRVLWELNKSLHRVEIVPYDLLGKRSEAVLKNVELYRLAAEGQVH